MTATPERSDAYPHDDHLPEGVLSVKFCTTCRAPWPCRTARDRGVPWGRTALALADALIESGAALNGPGEGERRG